MYERILITRVERRCVLWTWRFEVSFPIQLDFCNAWKMLSHSAFNTITILRSSNLRMERLICTAALPTVATRLNMLVAHAKSKKFGRGTSSWNKEANTSKFMAKIRRLHGWKYSSVLYSFSSWWFPPPWTHPVENVKFAANMWPELTLLLASNRLMISTLTVPHLCFFVEISS